MSDCEEILEALEETTKCKKQQDLLHQSERASPHAVRARRDDILRFLRELEGETTVEEVCDALEEYREADRGEDV